MSIYIEMVFKPTTRRDRNLEHELLDASQDVVAVVVAVAV